MRRALPILFAMLGVLMSLSTMSAAPWATHTAVDEHACCRPQPQKPPGNHHHDQDDGGTCLASCCRVISATDTVDVQPSGEESAATHAMTWSIVAFSLTDPDSIFHPPRA